MSQRFDKVSSVTHLEKGLRTSAVRGGAFTLGTQFSSLGLHIISTAILGRLLIDDDFGLVSLVASFIGVILIIKDAGFAQAVVQRDTITHEQVSTLFWLNIAMSLLMAAACAAMAPVMVMLFKRPELFNITLAMALAAFLGSFGGIHRALMQRQMRLASLSMSQITS
ncbi:MAG: oligosaccharide flippase family protein, partial [Phycisphaerales bacterium JB064]